jgi:glycerol kinase
MESGVLLGIDHGGTTTTALVFDPEKGKLAGHSVPMPKQTPQRGWVEHDPEDFLRTSLAAAALALADAGLSWSDVSGVGIANQGETSMAWSSGGGIGICPALSWEDRRTTEICEALAKKGVDDLIRERTGIRLDPYFSASKFRWLIDCVPEVAAAQQAGRLRLGGTDSYVIDRLTNGVVHATDAATCSRTALFNLRAVRWDEDLLAAFGLNEANLPEVRPTCGDFGEICHQEVPASKVPITADAVDAHAALFAQGCWDSTTVKATYGTGAFIEVNTGPIAATPDGKLPVFIAWELEDQIDYTVEGGVFSVGSAIDWVVGAGLLPSAEESAALAEGVSDSGGVIMVPSFTGLSAPYWESGARACLFGLGLDSEAGHIARALLDGIAFQCAEIIQAIDQKLDGRIAEVRADGGPTRNRYLMQRQADLLGLPVAVSLEPDMTALGAALLAGIGAGTLSRSAVAEMAPDMEVYEPKIGDDEREASWVEWRSAVAVVRDRATR